MIQYFDGHDPKPIFSAYIKDNYYTLPQSALRNVFSPGQRYYWKVTGIDVENKMIGESEVWSFTFKRPDEHVPGQIITFFAESTYSERVLNELKEKYTLQAIDVFPLKSVAMTVVLFETKEKDIFKLIDNIRKDSRILEAQPNLILRTMGEPLREMQYVSDILKLEMIHPYYKGRGIKVAVLDTGVDVKHNDLRERIVSSKNFIRNESYHAEIHGTAIAGVIAASINEFGIEGVAPNANIIALRACRQTSRETPEGECFTESLSKALDEAIMQRVHIVNMSYGTRHTDPLLSRLIDKGVEQGILFVAPIGNNRNEKEMRFPASYPSVISVGGIDEGNNPYPNPVITEKATVSAPAINIITTFPDNRHNFLSGTSFSSAYISGILALALEKDKSITMQGLPVYEDDLCEWEEALLKLSICEK